MYNSAIIDTETSPQNYLMPWVGIALIGIVAGVATSFGQTYLADPLKQLANSYSVWLFASFLSGIFFKSYRSSAVSGVIVQYLAIFSYAIVSVLRFNTGLALGANVVWLIGGTIVGPMCAISGQTVKRRSNYSAYAVAFQASLFLSESLYQFLSLHYAGEGLMFFTLGLVFLIAMVVKRGKAIVVTGSTFVMSLIIFIGYSHVLPHLMVG